MRHERQGEDKLPTLETSVDNTPYSMMLKLPIPCGFDISQLTIDGEEVTYTLADGYAVHECQNRATLKAIATFTRS